MLDCKAAFVEPPRRGSDLPPVQILLPNGTTVRSESGEVDRVLSAYFKRNVTLGRAAPDDFTIDQYHPDVEGADPGGNRDTVVASKLGAALFAELGMESPVPVEHRPWLTALLTRRPTKVAAIALANKIARIAWAMMAKGECYKEPAAPAA